VMCPRCNGGGDTEDTLPRFVLARRAGPPFVLGGFEGLTGDTTDTELRERDRLREKWSLPLVVEMGVGGGRTGLGVCLVPFMWYSFVVVELEMPENAEREDMCEVYELTLEGSPPTFGPPFIFDDALVFRANG
jgi:hypothetical protein